MLAATVVGAGLISGPVTGSVARAAENEGPSTPQEADVTVNEGTNLTAAAAPDGSTVIDLHGMLFRVPEGGGEASQLSPVEHETARPDVGPDGRIVYQSYDGGNFDIWVAGPDGSNPTQLTDGEFDYREPRWSPDGEHIAFSSDREKGSYDIWSIEVESRELTQWTSDAGDESQPAWSPDGEEIAHVAGNAVAAVNRDGDSRELAADPGEPAVAHAPSFSPDGEQVAWVRHNEDVSDLMIGNEAVTSGEDVFPFTPEWLDDSRLRYTADGKILERDLGAAAATEIPFEATLHLPGADYEKKPHDFDSRDSRDATVLTPQLSPDGESILFVALGDVWHMPLDGEPRQLTDDQFHEVNPVFSPDGKSIAYATDREGTQDIYIRSLETDEERRVTSLEGAEVSPAFSPDGTQLAFQDQDGATYVLDIESNHIRELVPEIFGPGRPSWSADGETIALAAVKQYSERFREGTSQILTVDVETGEQTFQAPGAPDASLSTRGDDGPVWSPDGQSLAFIIASQLYTMPVDAQGTATGDPRPVNEDVADAPSWSGDSSKLLYLSGGELKLADAATGDTETVEVPLQVEPHIEEGVKTIQAGAIWDGNSRELRENVDITIRDNRIEEITDRGEREPEGEVIDATELTVMPGMMDAHVHQALESRFLGDRQGRINLAYGVTSTLSMGDQAYRSLEERDSVDAGKRVAPRFFATGEPIDGSRVYYNFMRPTASDEDVDRELKRSENLDYDFFKTYVRLPAERMEKVIETAHDRGQPSASHYLSPGTFLGQDGTSHLAATQRLGYARTMSETGASYADIPAMYGEGNRMVMTTLFTEDFLQPGEFLDDPRFDLLPSWKQEALLEGVEGNTEDPSDPECQTAECREAQTHKRINEAGGQVLVGTDMPLDHVGIGMQSNLREMVGYGWDPYDALRAATVNPARFLGIDEDAGTLEPGKVADLIAVRGNPLEDIDTLMNVELSMVGGTAYTQAELLEPFGTYAEEPVAPGSSLSSGSLSSSGSSGLGPLGSDDSAAKVNEFADAAVANPEHLVADGTGHAH